MVMRGDVYLQEQIRQGLSAQQAQKRLVGQLQALWQLVFEDDAAYTDIFFNTVFRAEDAMVFEKDGEILSMLFLLAVAFPTDTGVSYQGRYVYAVATHPKARGKGYCGALLRQSEEEIAARGERFAALHPASETLYGFYRRFGYETAFSCAELLLPAYADVQNADGIECLLLSQQQFEKLYPAFGTHRRQELLWRKETLPFLYREAVAQRGGAFAVLREGSPIGCGLYYQPEDRMIIKDWYLDCTGSQREIVTKTEKALSRLWPQKEIFLRIPEKKVADWGKKAVSQPFGMIKYIENPFDGGALRNQYGFMGAVLD